MVYSFLAADVNNFSRKPRRRRYGILWLLLGFLVKRMLAAETAVLVELETIGIVLLVLCTVIVSLFAFAANECDLYSHVLSTSR